MDDKTPRKSLLRRALRAAVFLTMAAALALGALPWLLSTPPARNAVVSAVNRRIAPARLGVTGLSVSWAGSIRVTGLSLVDGHGKTLIKARLAVLDRGLAALALDHARLGTLTVDDASIDVERRADGSIDLVDALTGTPAAAAGPASTGPAPAPEPAPAPAAPAAAKGQTDLTVRVVRSRIKVTTPELAEPLTAGRLDMEVRLPALPGQKLSWRVRLAEPDGGTAAETLGADGELDHRAPAAADLSLTVKAERWPLAVATSGVVARGRLDGVLKVGREAGKWASTGDARLLGLDASGPALAGDRLRFDEAAAGWDLAETAAAWSVRKFGLVCPVGDLSASGSLAAGPGQPAPDGRVEGRVDLAALAKQIPHTLRLRDGLTLEQGSARVVIQVKSEGEWRRGSIDAGVSDLVAREAATGRAVTLRDPAALAVKGARGASGVSIEGLTFKSAFLNLSGSGDFQKGVRLSGTVDLGQVEEQFRDLIDFGGLSLAGQGRMAADYAVKANGKFLARYASEFRALKVAGLTAEPVARESLRFDVAGSGPAGADGLPGSWQAVRVNLKSGLDAITVSAQTKDGVTAVIGSASVPLTVSQRDGLADARFAGRYKPRKDPSLGYGLVEFDELRLGLRPADPALAGAGALAFAAKGYYDLDGEDLALTPLPAPSPVVLGPEGLKLHGLRKTPLGQRAAQAVVIGDLAAVEQALQVWTGREPGGLGGALSAHFGMGAGENGQLNVALNVSVPDLSRPAADGKARKPEGPFALGIAGRYDPAADRLSVDQGLAMTRYARLDLKGRLDDPAGRRFADVAGTVTPNWETLSALAAEATEPRAKLQGKGRDFHVKGPLAGGPLAETVKGLDAEVGLELTSAEFFGMALGPAPVVVRCKGGALTVDPIQTTLNNGKVDLKPGLSVDDARGIALLLAPGSTIDGAEINDEVSRDLLSYIAPVLDRATNVHGKISVAVDKAVVPLTGPPTEKTTMTGRLDFQDVVFAPGPFARQMLALVGKANEPGVRLHQPVELSVVDDRVYQKGLSVPITRDAALTLAGSVGFDQTLDLKAVVPITKGMLGPVSGLDGLVGDNRITVPVAGTVSHPQVNKRALQVALRELSRNVLKRDLGQGASQLLDKLGPRGGSPNPNPNPGTPGNGPAGLSDRIKGLENEFLQRALPGDKNP